MVDISTIANLLVKMGWDGSALNAGATSAVAKINQISASAKASSASMSSLGVAATSSASGMSSMAGAAATSALGMASVVAAGVAVVAVLGQVVTYAKNAAEALLEFSAEAVTLGSNLNEVQNVVDVTFGASADAINDFALTAMTSFGISETAAKKYAGTLGAMLKSSGVDTSSITTMSTALTGLAGDLASFYNLSTDEAFAKIQSGLAGEIEPLRQLGITLSVANLNAYALSQGMSETYDSMTDADKLLVRYQYLMQASADAQGDFVRTGGGWANQVRVMSTAWDAFKTAIGQGIIPLILPIVQLINNIIPKLTAIVQAMLPQLEAVGQVISDVFTDIGNTIGPELTELADAIMDAFTAVSSAMTGAVGAWIRGVGQIINAYGPIIIAFLQLLTNYVVAWANGINMIFGSIFPKIEIATATVANVDTSGIDGLTDSVTAAGTAAKKALAPFDQLNILASSTGSGGGSSSGIGAAVSDAASAYKVGVPTIPDFGKVSIWSQIKKWIKKQWTKAVDNLGDAWDIVKDWVLDTWDTAIDNLGEAWDIVKDWILGTWNTAIKNLGTAWSIVKTWLLKQWSTAVENLGDSWQIIKTWIVSQWNKGIQNIGTLYGNLAAVFGISYDDMSGKLLAIRNNIQGQINSIISAVAFVGTTVIRFIVDPSSVTSELQILETKFKGFINTMILTINIMIRKINKIGFTLPSWLGGGSFHFSIDTLPMLARGGMVDGATTAIIGEKGKEAVLPLENDTSALDLIVSKLMASMQRQGGAVAAGGGATYIYLDSDEISYRLERRTNTRAIRTNGR